MKGFDFGRDYLTREDRIDDLLHIYTLVNMGDDEYQLLFEEKYTKYDEEMLYSIDAAVDEDRNYIRIVLDTHGYERTILTDGQAVTSDSIYVKPKKLSHLGRVYNSTIAKGNISLEEYLQMTPTFLDELDREFTPDIDTSEAFREFLSASKRYNSGMKLQRVPREE